MGVVECRFARLKVLLEKVASFGIFYEICAGPHGLFVSRKIKKL